MADPIILGMATMPSRLPYIKKTLKSLYPQVDEIRIACNSFSSWQQRRMKWKIRGMEDKVKVFFDYPDYKCASKFKVIEGLKGFMLTVDDDIIYPSDYVKVMMDSVKKYDKKVIIGVHGRILPDVVTDYYKDRTELFHFQYELKRDRLAHTIGTGVMAWHTDTIEFTLADFPKYNSEDIYVAIKAQSLGVPLIVISHKADWLIDQNASVSIFNTYKGDPEITTRYNSWTEWKLVPPEGFEEALMPIRE